MQKVPDHLQHVIHTETTSDCLPVLTLANAERIRTDRDYAEQTAVRLLEYLLDIENYRGTADLRSVKAGEGGWWQRQSIICRYFDGVSTAAISKTVQLPEARRIGVGIGSWRSCWQNWQVPGIPPCWSAGHCRGHSGPRGPDAPSKSRRQRRGNRPTPRLRL